MRKLAEKADGLLALHQPQSHDLHAVVAASITAVGAQPPASQKDDLVAAASAGKGGQPGKKKKKRSGRPLRRSRSPVDFQSPLCNFHVRYGDKAHRCEEPCAWPGN
jgi:hypothetical protein